MKGFRDQLLDFDFSFFSSIDVKFNLQFVNFGFESIHTFFGCVIGDWGDTEDVHFDAILVVVRLALRLGHELEEGVPDVVQLPPEILWIVIKKRTQFFGRKSNQFLSRVVE